MFLDVSKKATPMTARYIAPRFPRLNLGQSKCLLFSYNIFGKDGGKIMVFDEKLQRLWHYEHEHQADLASEWVQTHVTMGVNQTLFVLEAERGGVGKDAKDGEICFDNILVIRDSCDSKLLILLTLVNHPSKNHANSLNSY